MRTNARHIGVITILLVVCTSLASDATGAQLSPPESPSSGAERGWEQYEGRTLVAVDWVGLEAGLSNQLSELSGWTVGAKLEAKIWNEIGGRLHTIYSTEGYFDCHITAIELRSTEAGVRARIRSLISNAHRTFGSASGVN